MEGLTGRIHQYFWKGHPHPYKLLEESLGKNVRSGMTVLEHGCGRGAPILSTLIQTGADLHGIDLEEFTAEIPGLTLTKGDISSLDYPAEKFDLVFSRSVMEHVADPLAAYQETYRVLKPGGKWIFLTPNMWDYVSVIARIVPNKFHGTLVNHTEGREEHDVFPTVYGSNSFSQVNRLAKSTGFEVLDFQYLGQHPAYLKFNPVLYFLGSLYEKTILSTSLLQGVRGWLFITLEKKSIH